MPRPRSVSRWSHPLYRVGYCFERYGNVYTRVGNVKQATGLVWHDKNRKAALAMLEEQVKTYLNPVKAEEAKAERQLIEAITEFLAVYLPNLSDAQRRQHKRALKTLLPNNTALKNTDEIRQMISENLQAYEAHNNTKIGLLKRIHTFFEFCIHQGWMDKNPAKMIVKPKEIRTDINPFTRSELIQMIAYNRKTGDTEFALLLEFLGQTAMRIGETLKLRWCDIDEEKIVVDGKGGIEREIPIETFPKLIEVLRELRTFNEVSVFRWNTLPVIQRLMKATCEALAIEARGFHAIRKMRENEWIDDEGIPPHIAAYLCGHSVAVQEKSYRKKPRATELKNLLTQARGGQSGDKHRGEKRIGSQ
jgi:integrase